MPRAEVTLKRIRQDSQEYGSDDEHMVSRVFFDMTLEGRQYKDLYVDIKQTVGSDFETAPIEVSPPGGYEGPFNHAEFRRIVEAYYRSLVGSAGRAIHIAGARNVRMRDNVIERHERGQFEVSRDGRGAW